ncbi:MAG: UDP-N-acetylmuramoyl-L-alanyl-D-glutamate--2,6-diaminopimelate ligase [Vulcanimicrobiaceae bacterium]
MTIPKPTRLAALIAALDHVRTRGPLERPIRALAHDSRAVAPGSLFVAVRGERVDGHAYIADALARGADAVVHEERARIVPSSRGATTIAVPDSRRALSRLAATFYGDPSRDLAVTGITGTNGKTTTSFMLEAILVHAGVATARLGTLGVSFDDTLAPLTNTTPLALELQAILARLRERGARAVAMGVSSHALALDRVTDVRFVVGVLTNVTRDHLDFHGSLDRYAAVKRTLFDRAEHAILNLDDPFGARWADELQRAGRPVTTYAIDRAADVRAECLEIAADATSFVVGETRMHLRLPGRFNVANALAAIAAARRFEIADTTIAAALAELERVPGRMERFVAGGIVAVVDYAHTPDALTRVLEAARELARKRLIVVFGCGGDRDRGKRPEMGRIAERLADYVVVTSDNPRSESPATIAAEIVAGIVDRGNAAVELDRRAAIRLAIDGANSGDVVVIAGKGHEDYQIVGDQTTSFDDRDEVRAALRGRSLQVKAPRL